MSINDSKLQVFLVPSKVVAIVQVNKRYGTASNVSFLRACGSGKKYKQCCGK